MKENGYPQTCNKCISSNDCLEKMVALNVEPFYQQGNDYRLMLIGQDPTIFVEKERVKQVLMLDEPNGQLRRWLENLFGKEIFNNFTIYATNVVKCTFPKPPSTYGGKHFLKPYFENCKNYLEQEVLYFRPNLILSFGEPAHRYFSSMFDNSNEIGSTMQSALGNEMKFFKAKIKDCEFSYSPSLHIKTFRVAETYGKRIENFKYALKSETRIN
ncbi:MAG TPA: hypothetical protein DHV28_16290 [Ignavibacteriales bacterium]|nr:hypothetical protein [Ignavibacteriales bacterium]